MLKRGQLLKFGRQHRKLKRTFPGNTLMLWMLRESLPSAFRFYRRRQGGENLLRQDAFDSAAKAESKAARLNPSKSSSLLTKRPYSDYTRTILPGLLHYGDAISMGQSIESRLPFRTIGWPSGFFQRRTISKLTRVQLKSSCANT